MENENELLFYSTLDEFYFSFSSLNLLLTKPKLFYKKYILQEEINEETKYFFEGSLFHCKLLEPETFDDKYKLINITLPEGNLKNCLDHIIDIHLNTSTKKTKLSDYKENILEYLISINLYQAFVDDKKEPFKTGDEKRLDKIITPAAIEYFDLYVNNTDKILIDIETDLKITDKVNALLQDETYQEILALEKTEGWNSNTELELTVNKDMLPGFSYGLKGIVDKILWNNKEKHIIIFDAKTTSGTLDQFPETAKKYMYHLQGAIYKKLITSFLKDDPTQWHIDIFFGVVDKYNDAYSFILSHDTETIAQYLLNNALKKDGIVNQVFEAKYYRLSYEYFKKTIKI